MLTVPDFQQRTNDKGEATHCSQGGLCMVAFALESARGFTVGMVLRWRVGPQAGGKGLPLPKSSADCLTSII